MTAPGAGTKLQHPAIVGSVVLLSLWLISPALTSVHVEGFSANLQTLAILMHKHGRVGLRLADQQYPVVTEYLYMTRSGVVGALQFLMALTRQTGDGIFRALMLVSMAVYTWACLRLARRWGGEPWILLCLALLLTPGLVEISFYFADNLPSAACAMLALTLIERDSETPEWRWLVMGLLFAAAILVRVDAVLTAPAFCLGMLRPRRRIHQVLLSGVLFAAGAVLCIMAAQWFTPFQLGDSFKVSSLFANLHEHVRSHKLERGILVFFFGLLTPVFVLLGAFRNGRSHAWRWNFAFLLVPGLFYLYAAPRALETRMLLLLGGPALLMHAATGIRIVGEWWGSAQPLKKAGAYLVLACTVVLFVGPVEGRVQDGPRTLLGRLWTPVLWREWQSSVQNDMRQLDELARSVSPHETVVVISGHFNADHYLRMRLLQDGFDLLPSAAGGTGECASELEVFQKGDRRIVHVRSEEPYLLVSEQPESYIRSFQLITGLKCLQGIALTRVALVTWLNVPPYMTSAVTGSTGEIPTWSVKLPASPLMPTWKSFKTGEVYVQALTPEQIKSLETSVTLRAGKDLARADGWQPFGTYTQLHDLYRWHFGAMATGATR